MLLLFFVSSTDVLYGATEGCLINFCDDDDDVTFHNTQQYYTHNKLTKSGI